MNLESNKSLKKYNTFGIEASASLFFEFKNEADLLEMLKNNSKPLLVLGGGSNILFTQNFDGLVLRNAIKGIELISETEENVFIRTGAGEIWHQFVMHCIDNNWAGVENLSLIPGTVGAAPMQNIGAYGVEIKSVFESLDAIHCKTFQKRTFTNQECKFGYRESVFKHELKGEYIITSVTFKLSKIPQINASYGAITDVLKEKNIDNPTIKDISDAVIQIRTSKLPNPEVLGNAGSFFKNPEIAISLYEQLKSDFPTIVGYPTENGVKLAAGWLIEQCGWKGKIVGNTGSHKDQALVLVNYGNATGNEIYQLALAIKKSVFDKFGVEINPEVNIV
jgi:UDP-N-acetylmuramate dehydrogenase